MESIWKEAGKKRQTKCLTGTHHTKVAVIGAGMAGVLTAYLLKEAGVKVVVVEADEIGSGQTGNTTAKITSQHGMIYGYLEKHFGKEGAALYVDANESAVREYEKIIKNQQVECSFRHCPVIWQRNWRSTSIPRCKGWRAIVCLPGREFWKQSILYLPVIIPG